MSKKTVVKDILNKIDVQNDCVTDHLESFFLNSKTNKNFSILFSKGKRLEKFFTEDSKLYITPREMKLLEKGVRLDRRLKKWDNLSSRIIFEYTKKNHSKNDFLLSEFKRRYEMLNDGIYDASNNFFGNFSFQKMGNFSVASLLLVAMFSMTMVYRYAGKNEKIEGSVLGMSNQKVIENNIKNQDRALEESSIKAMKSSKNEDTEDVDKISKIKKESFKKVSQINETKEAESEKLEIVTTDFVEPAENGGVRIYNVKAGDTISGIAKNHNITINTILWANDIVDVNSIKPGDEIFILPVSGNYHKIAAGENIDYIALRYGTDAEKILSFNNISSPEEIKEGMEIIIPGEKINESSLASKELDSLNNSGLLSLTGKPGEGHAFPYGYCTWYVSQKKYIPWSGNAGSWLYNAKSLGYETGKTPKKGAVVVTTEDRRYGHVAYVEDVKNDEITISEMNFDGWAKKSKRTLPLNSPVIRGYIY